MTTYQIAILCFMLGVLASELWKRITPKRS